jgi:hypothetical protein
MDRRSCWRESDMAFISADGVAEINPDWHFPYFDENMGPHPGLDLRGAATARRQPGR